MQDMMVGDEARKHCRKQKMNSPVDNIGIVRNWEDMKHLWDYAFGETKLNVDPKTCKVSYKREILNKLYNAHDLSKNFEFESEISKKLCWYCYTLENNLQFTDNMILNIGHNFQSFQGVNINIRNRKHIFPVTRNAVGTRAVRT